MTYVTYCRVSTDKQGIRGLGMDAQRDAVEAHARRSNGEIVAAYIEAESGKNHSNRPQLIAALAHCKRIGATLLIAKLDRLARNVAFISSLMESGVEFVAADMPTANRLTIHILAAVAEHERAMISTRVKEALAQAKLRGTKLGGARPGAGNPRASLEMANHTRQLTTIKRDDAIRIIIPYIQKDGHTTLRAIASELDRLGYVAPRGGAWTATQVSRVMKAGK